MNATIDGVPEVTTWKGRDIRELSREELIEALEWATRAYNDALNRNIRSMEMMRLFQSVRY